MPWAAGKKRLTKPFAVALATWAKSLPWLQVARHFRCSWSSATEFLRRFLQHFLTDGFHKVRYFGFLHPTNKGTLRKLQLVLWKRDQNRTAAREREIEARTRIEKLCPHCKKGTMVVVAWLPRRSRSPPLGEW